MSARADTTGADVTVAHLVDSVAALLFDTPYDAEARQQSLALVAAVMQQPLWWPVVHSGSLVSAPVSERVRGAAERLARGMPFAYAVGTAAFRNLLLAVDERVLIPRPETELLVDIVANLSRTRPVRVVADVGTGSGAIALSLAAEMECERVIATDISLDALRLAKENARQLSLDAHARLDFRHGDALAPLLGERLDVLVSNPPYIAFAELAELPKLVRDWEPTSALVCAGDGMAVTRQLVQGAGAVLAPGALLALEVDSRRGEAVRQFVDAASGFTEVMLHQDLAGRDRFVTARWSPDQLQ